jgi:hypothetical protein
MSKSSLALILGAKPDKGHDDEGRKVKKLALRQFREALHKGDDEAALDALDALQGYRGGGGAEGGE